MAVGSAYLCSFELVLSRQEKTLIIEEFVVLIFPLDDLSFIYDWNWNLKKLVVSILDGFDLVKARVSYLDVLWIFLFRWGLLMTHSIDVIFIIRNLLCKFNTRIRKDSHWSTPKVQKSKNNTKPMVDRESNINQLMVLQLLKICLNKLFTRLCMVTPFKVCRCSMM